MPTEEEEEEEEEEREVAVRRPFLSFFSTLSAGATPTTSLFVFTLGVPWGMR